MFIFAPRHSNRKLRHVLRTDPDWLATFRLGDGEAFPVPGLHLRERTPGQRFTFDKEREWQAGRVVVRTDDPAIRERAGNPLVEPSQDAIKAALAANDIPLGASDAVMTMATALARDSLANGQYETAALCSAILHDVARG